ncbi:biopolymer transport protein ExbD [Pirellulimonas nuda]|uniref:Biopolymer transport protein ExbD n=1 Tax=Pirellulimonas nuda TaxID=2528009 RepID=A0A518D9P5_9BACT|nr:biopolymer transporter ExbD [Pirellulimonas nuda]QDU88209.1 biopolymer transport protein ExbD [Pirellulimonas nuda]
MRIKKRSSLDMAEGDMTPMIDMTFQLIAFFMVLINFSEVEQDQRVNLPASQLAKPPDTAYEEPLTIQMVEDGVILFGGDDMDLSALETALRKEAQIIRAYADKRMSDVTVIIRADKLAKAGQVQEIIKVCQDTEFDNFALRGQQTDESTLGGP